MNIYWLGEGIKHLPNDLLCLKLQLDNNNLGQNQENIKSLAEGLKQLPNNLQYL